MQLPTILGRMIKSGELTITTNENEALTIKAENQKIDLDIKDKELIKLFLASGGSGNTSISKTLAQIKEIADELKEEGLTITITYEDDTIITIGAQAKSTLSRIVTGTKNIEINNLMKLIKLGL